MSTHPSLRSADALKGERSVLSRFERIHSLSKDGRLDPEKDSALGLPKVRTKFKVPKKKKAKAEAEPGAEGESTGSAEAPEAAKSPKSPKGPKGPKE